MARTDEVSPPELVEVAGQGVFLHGAFMGVKRPSDYNIDGRSGTSRPKFGVEVDGEEFSVLCEDERELYRLTVESGWEKGLIVMIRVYPVSGRFGLRWQTSRRTGGAWE